MEAGPLPTSDGASEGLVEGTREGLRVGAPDGILVGNSDGICEQEKLQQGYPKAVASLNISLTKLGRCEGANVGSRLGCRVGTYRPTACFSSIPLEPLALLWSDTHESRRVCRQLSRKSAGDECRLIRRLLGRELRGLVRGEHRRPLRWCLGRQARRHQRRPAGWSLRRNDGRPPGRG
jgi:hypothetical protein